MPIYEYDCPSCGRIEVIQKASEKALKSCPECAEKGKKNPVEKIVSSSSFQLKGSGWYKTDYASGSSSSGSSSSKASKSDKAEKSEKSDSSGSDSKDSKKEAAPAAKGCGTGACGCH